MGDQVYLSSNNAFRAIERINAASGLMKQKVLRENPGLAPYLRAAYDPFKRYYMTTNVEGQGNFEFESATWEMLDFLHARHLSGSFGQQMLDTAAMGMTPESAELLKRILKKDLRMGMGVKTINKVFPGLVPTHDVMLAKLFNRHRVKFPCFASPKIDGVRAIFRDGKFYSRNGHIYEGLEHLEEKLQKVPHVLDGELTVPGKTFQVASGLIRSDFKVPGAAFSVFDLPDYRQPFINRLTRMDDILYNVDPKVSIVNHMLMKDLDQLMDFYEAARGLGYEGAMVKPYDYKYKGTRSWDWMKMKNVSTEDLKVIDVFEGEGKYVGQLGGIVVDYNGTSVRVGSGFTDDQRERLWGIPEYVIGRVAEVLFMEVTDSGSLRHPRFVQFRPDKASTYGGI
jgi:DNA ligase-1